MKKIIISLLLLLLVKISFTQTVSPITWYFGHQAGIKFKINGGTEPKDGNIMAGNNEGSTIVNDMYGNIIFYASGEGLFTPDFSQAILDLPGGNSATQSPLVVRIPGVTYDDNNNPIYKFLLFVIPGVAESGTPNFFVSLIQATQSGIGPSYTYNIQPGLVLSVNQIRMSEKLATCKDEGEGYWLVAHDYYQNQSCRTFYIYHINNDFINVTSTEEVVDRLSTHLDTQETGSDYMGRYENGQGQIKFNSERTKLGLTICGAYTFEIFRFDYQTGRLSDSPEISYTISNPHGFLYGCEFSPDGHLFYTSEGQDLGQPWQARYIYQWDIKDGLSLPPYEVTYKNDSHYEYCAMQKGPNDKIYCTHKQSNYTLSVINDPNQAAACNYQEDVVDIGGSSAETRLGLPSYYTLEFEGGPPPGSCGCTLSTAVGPITNINKQAGTATVILTLNSGALVAKSVIIDFMNFNMDVTQECVKKRLIQFPNMGMLGEPIPMINGLPGSFSTWEESTGVVYSREIEWDLSMAPSTIINQQVELQLQFPLIGDLSCCPVQYFAGFRISFIDENCQICQSKLYSQSQIIEKIQNSEKYSGQASSKNSSQILTNQDNLGSQTSKSNSFLVFPNPNEGKFTINAVNLGSNLNYMVADDKGRVVKRGVLNSGIETVDIPWLSDGLYFVKIIKDGKEYIQKVMIRIQ